MEYGLHETVLKDECCRFLLEKCEDNKQIFLADLTFGGGGHSLELLRRNENATLFGVDQDPEAFQNAKELVIKNGVQKRVNLLHCNFKDFPDHIEKSKGPKLDGILMDLGVSSHHFDDPKRGFSFRSDGPLDMRMNFNHSEINSAKDVVNSLDEEELKTIFDKYGEERYSGRIARAIVEKREEKEISSTKELEDIIFHAYPKQFRFGRTHPATRVFQALRIFVNDELNVLSYVIPRLIPTLRPGGRLAIITFHSLEDRIVKHTFLDLKRQELVNVLTKKPILPSEDEISRNNRSRSAKLRVIEKI